MQKNNAIVWDGIYNSFSEAPHGGDAFASDTWVDKIALVASNTLDSLKDCKQSIAPIAITHEYILPVVAAMAREPSKPLTIIDFGGGLAPSYFALRASLGDDSDLSFHIVECESVVERAKDLFATEPGLSFHASLPDLETPITIAHAGSSLHYIEDWQDLLKQLCSYSPRYVLLADLLAGDIKTFVTTQLFYDDKIPVWFWNIHEIIDAMAALNYQLIFKSHLTRQYRNQTGPLPMSNLPQEYQLQYPCQLLFTQQP